MWCFFSPLLALLSLLLAVAAFQRPPRAAARFDAEELFDRAFDRFRAGGDVAGAEFGREVNLVDRRAARGDEEFEHVDHRFGVADVGRRVFGEDVEQVVAAEHQVLHRHPLAGGADEVLLAGGANEVGVGVPVAHVLQRLFAAEQLVAGLDVDFGIFFGGFRVRVVVAPVDVDVDAIDRIDGADEAEEVDVDHVVDRQTGQFLDHAQGQFGAAVAVGGVELVGADAGDFDLQVTRDRHQRDRVSVGVEAEQHRRVGAAGIAGQAGSFVGAEDEDVLRLAAVGLGEEFLDFVLQHVVVRERLGDAVDEEQDAGRGRRGGDDDDHQGAEREAQPEPLRLRRRLVPSPSGGGFGKTGSAIAQAPIRSASERRKVSSVCR